MNRTENYVIKLKNWAKTIIKIMQFFPNFPHIHFK